MINPYSVLGIDNYSSVEVAKEAFKTLAVKHHPDRTEGKDDTKFKEINSAYQMLQNPQEKEKIDNTLRMQEVGFGFGSGYSRVNRRPGFHDINHDIFSGMNADFADIFSMFNTAASRSTHRSQQNAVRGSDISGTIHLTLAESIFGCEKNIRIKQTNGNTTHNTTTHVFIPPGTKNGSSIIKKLFGGAGNPPGDLIINVMITEDQEFTLINDTVSTVITLNPVEAKFGCTRYISYFGRNIIKVDIKCEINDGEIITINDSESNKLGVRKLDITVMVDKSKLTKRAELLMNELAEELNTDKTLSNEDVDEIYKEVWI